MKRLIATLLIVALSQCALYAQQTDDATSEIYSTQNGNNLLSAEDDGSMSLIINGKKLIIGTDDSKATECDNTSKKRSRVRAGFMGIGSPYHNHLALFEFGASFFVGESYNGYTQEEVDAISLSNSKSFNMSMNVMDLHVSLDKNDKIVFTTGIGFSFDWYRLLNRVTLGYENNKIYAIPLGDDIKRSSLQANYMRIPIYLDWNISKRAFLSVGANVDILIGSALHYLKPRTTVQGTMPINPVQVGVTARIGWNCVYAYINYTPMNFYKNATNINANRMSAGVGFWF